MSGIRTWKRKVNFDLQQRLRNMPASEQVAIRKLTDPAYRRLLNKGK